MGKELYGTPLIKYEVKKMLNSTVTSKGQVTIPKKIREFLNVRTSDKIVFIPVEVGKVIITVRKNSASELFGMLKHRRQARLVSIREMDSTIRKRRSERMTY
jgi:AbrB family looped-hinge helix DNA binding protein